MEAWEESNRYIHDSSIAAGWNGEVIEEKERSGSVHDNEADENTSDKEHW